MLDFLSWALLHSAPWHPLSLAKARKARTCTSEVWL